MIINHILPTKTVAAEVLPFIQGPEQVAVLVVIGVVVTIGLLAILFDVTDEKVVDR